VNSHYLYFFKGYAGWRRCLLAALLGIMAALALPPLYLLPLLVPAFSGLFLLLREAKTLRQAFFDGWWWGLGHFTAGLYWMCISLYVEPEKFAWLTPFALLGIPSVVAIYTGTVAIALVAGCRLQVANLPLLLFPTLWTIAEYLRAHWFTGFPWNLIGYAWTASDVTLQAVSLTGIYGLGWITVFIATAPALFVLKEKPALPNALAALLIVCMVIFGGWRLDHNPTQYSNVRIRIVQADIPQAEKSNAEAQYSILRKYLDMTRSPGLEAVNMVIWPEAAVPYYMESGSILLRDMGSVLPEGALLATGGLRGNSGRKEWQSWNSLFVLDHTGKILAQYDKHHLVPFGEFIPFRHILPVENISGGHGDFSYGKGPATIAAGALPPFSPLICYEAIFPDEATDGTHRAKWLLNVTNDAWFGVSSGPYQHLQMARVRAVENGLPLIRAANTGISAVIDPFGRILRTLPLEQEGIIDSYLPLPAYP
jgi:apolipoprotein N-acyltransferase